MTFDQHRNSENDKKPWTPEEERELIRLKQEGKSLKDISAILGRSTRAIEYRWTTYIDPNAKMLYQFNEEEREAFLETVDRVGATNSKEISQQLAIEYGINIHPGVIRAQKGTIDRGTWEERAALARQPDIPQTPRIKAHDFIDQRQRRVITAAPQTRLYGYPEEVPTKEQINRWLENSLKLDDEE